MEYRVLGPLEAVGDDGPLALGGEKQRALLALLLLNANRVVSRERLIDQLWGDEPPETAVAMVQVYVSRLRKLLPPGTLMTRPPGYVLAAEPEAVDVLRFERMLVEARDAEPAHAAELLRDAEQLWRGPALSEFAAEPFAGAEAGRLEDMRVVALEHRIEADLALGRHAGLIGELEVLIAEHPHREGLRSQLMRALYASGRRAEALEAYRDARAALDEIGIEPSEHLRELERAILTHDGATPETVSAPLATGVLTFLTLVVDSPLTSLWDSEREAMDAAVERRDGLFANAVEAHGGHVLHAGSESDTRAAAFQSAAAGARAALDASGALANATWPDGAPMSTRFGLHSGEAQAEDDRYHGTTVLLAARICAEADGGEVLLSETTTALIVGALPKDYAIVELGRLPVEGIARPEGINALVGPGLTTTPAAGECPYRGLIAFGTQDRHLFFGREEVLADVLGRIGPGRLLAVVGASGTGKSSLLQAGVLAAVQEGELACARSARLLTPGAEPPLDLGDDESALLIVDQFKELYTQCRDVDLRTRFIDALLSRIGPVVIGVRADFYGELAAHAGLAAAVAGNQVLLGPMLPSDLRRAIAEPARLAGLRLDHGLVDVVLRDVADEPGALPLMSHALLETWERREVRTLTVEAYEESGGVSSALARSADAVVAEASTADRVLLRNVFLRLTEVGDDQEDARRRTPIGELIPEGSSEEAVRSVLERLVAARLVILDDGTAELAHEVLTRRWPTLRRWLDEDREGIRLHRRIGDAARLWEASGREPADLFRGTRLDAAVEWAGQNRDRLNWAELDFLNASVRESVRTQRAQLTINRRLRRALIASASLLLATGALLFWALTQRSDAIRASKAATSLALASASTSVGGTNLATSLLLGLDALHAAKTPQARTAVARALQKADGSGVDAILRSCGEVNSVAFAHGGETLAVGCNNGNTVLWRLASGKPRGAPVTLPPGGGCNRVRGVAFGSDEKSLAVGCDEETLVFDMAAGKPRGTPISLLGSSCDAVDSIAFGWGMLAAGCRNGNTGLWDIAKGRGRGDPTTLPRWSYCDSANNVVLGQGGRTLAVGCNNGNTALWKLAAGKPRGMPVVLASAGSCNVASGVVVSAIAFDSRRGTLAVGCNDGNTVLWHLQAGKPRGVPVVLSGARSCNEVNVIAFSSDGKTLAAGCANGNILRWDVAAGKTHGPIVVAGSSSCDAADGLALGGATVAVGCADGNTLLLRDVVAKELRGNPVTLPSGKSCDAVNSVAFGGRTLAVACDDGNTVLWDIASGTPRGEPNTLPGGSPCPEALAVAFDAAREKLAVGCTGETVVWGVVNGRPRAAPVTLAGRGHCPKALTVAFESGGGTLAVGCSNGTTLLYDLTPSKQSAGPLLLRYRDSCDVVYGVAFRPGGGTLAVGCYNGNTVLWEIAAGKPRGTPVVLSRGSSCSAVYGLTFVSGGRTLAVGCYNGTALLWNIAAGKPRGEPVTIPGGSSCEPLLGVAFSADAGTLAMSCHNGNAVLWNIAAGRALSGPVMLPTRGGCDKVYGAAFGPRGRTLALGCADGDTMLWNVAPWATDFASVQSRVCRFVSGDLTPAEWSTLAPGLRYQAHCRAR